jgi:hypothetical protein
MDEQVKRQTEEAGMKKKADMKQRQGNPKWRRRCRAQTQRLKLEIEERTEWKKIKAQLISSAPAVSNKIRRKKVKIKKERMWRQTATHREQRGKREEEERRKKRESIERCWQVDDN